MPLKSRCLERTHICSTRYLQILGITCGSITTNITTNSYVALWPGLRMSSRRNPHAAPCQGFWFCFEIPCKRQVQTEKKNVESFLMRNTKAGHMARVHLSDTCRNGGTLCPFHLSCLRKGDALQAQRLPCQLWLLRGFWAHSYMSAQMSAESLQVGPSTTTASQIKTFRQHQ